MLSQINYGQYKINFADITIEQATQRANIENKPIFVDTYAKWCKPCKKMDIVFKDQKLAKFINKNFISVKIDMDKDYGKIVSSKYQIAFLPTLLVLDQNGNTKYKIDRLATANELLSIAELTVNGFIVSKQEEEIPKEIFNQTSQSAKSADSDEKILYVLSPDAENLPPEILFQEAYFRMELMDGSHRATAEKYIQTQDDWFEEKNIKFIFDFLYDTNTKTFDFFIENKSLFDQIVGKENADYSLQILINNRLFNGIPRPDLEEASYLYSLTDPIDYEHKAYQYYLSRSYEEGNEEFLSTARTYLEQKDKYNQDIVLNFCNACLDSNKAKADLALCSQSIEEIDDPEKNYNYYATIAQLNYILIEKDDALKAANLAIELAKKENTDFSDMSQLLVKIKML